MFLISLIVDLLVVTQSVQSGILVLLIDFNCMQKILYRFKLLQLRNSY